MNSLDKIENYLKFGNITVEVKYSDNNKSINDCILNILKEKMKQ